MARHTRGVSPLDATLDALLEPLRRDPAPLRRPARRRRRARADRPAARRRAHARDDAPAADRDRPRATAPSPASPAAAPPTRGGSSPLGSIAYLGNHGSEILRPGAIAPEVDRELQAWTRRVQGFMREAYSDDLRQLRVRLEDKEAIAALHWRGVPDEEGAEQAIRGVAARAEAAGLQDPLGPQGARDPPARADRQGRRHRLAAARRRPRRRDLRRRRPHRPRRVPRPRASSSTWAACRPRSRSACAPTRARRSSSARPTRWSTGPTGCALLLQSLVPADGPLMRFVDFLKSTVLLCAGAATLLAALTIVGGARTGEQANTLIARRAGGRLAAVIGAWIGRHHAASPPIARLLADAKMQTALPEPRPGLHARQPALAAARRHGRGGRARRSSCRRSPAWPRASRSSGRSPGAARTRRSPRSRSATASASTSTAPAPFTPIRLIRTPRPRAG